MHEQLEKVDDPPIYIYRMESSPQMVSSFNGFTSYQVNIDSNGNNILGDAANEPSLTVDPTNHNRMAVGWRQFDSVASNFRQAGRGFSTDGGMTWNFPGVLEPGLFRSDPVLGADESGRFFYLSLLQSFYDNMWRSLDEGANWTLLGPATGGDKQWFTIDRTNSSGHGFQYQYWSTAGNNYQGRQFSRSTDGGATWLDPVFVPQSPIWGTLDVDSDGNLFLVGANPNTKEIWCERSTNAKDAAAVPSFDQVTRVLMGGVIDSGRPINPEGLTGQLYIGIDRSGTSTNNNVYLLGSLRSGANGGTDVMFVRSTNRGQTFSSARRINDDPVNPNKWHWLAALAVAPHGRLDAVWLDSRNGANNTDSQLFYSYSVDAGVTWSQNVAVSAPFSPLIGYPNQNKIGDYISLVSDKGGADVAYCGTFNGEEDVYYVRVAPQLAQLQSISTRARILTGDNVLIAGFEVTGPVPKQVIVRGIGPSLTQFGLTDVLGNPTLTLNRGSTVLATNDNWKTRPNGTSQEAEVLATNRAPQSDLESAIVATLDPGSYTAIVSGSGGTGIGLVQVYDLSPGTASELSSISTRGFVDTNDNVLIGGITIGGGDGGGSRVMLRAIGPSLSAFGVQGVLADPTLSLYNVNGDQIAANDDWKSEEAAVRTANLAPDNDRESAILIGLAPGDYTAVVRGKNNTTGVALVQAYKVP